MDINRIDELKTKIQRGETLTKEETLEILELLDKQMKNINRLQQKGEILQQQNLELMQEMENIRDDFTGGR